jgi:hypothetical protein
MSKKSKVGDSIQTNLQALFDSIARSLRRGRRGCGEEPSLLQQLRGRTSPTIATNCRRCSTPSPQARAPPAARRRGSDGRARQWQGQGVQPVGQMARQLHDTLRELGYTELLEARPLRHPRCAPAPQLRRHLDRAGGQPGAQRHRHRRADAGRKLRGQAAALAALGCAVRQPDLSVEEFKRWPTTRVPSSAGVGDTARDQGAAARNHDGAGLPGPHRAGDQEDRRLAQDAGDATAAGADRDHARRQVLGDRIGGLLNGPVINADGRSDVVARTSSRSTICSSSLGF